MGNSDLEYRYNSYTAKHLPFLILDILKNLTDEDHTIRLNELKEKIEKHYGFEASTKTIKSNIEVLKGLEYDIQEKGKGGGWYLKMNYDFDSSEIKMISDSIMFSKHIPSGFSKDIINRLQRLSDVSNKEKLQSAYISQLLVHESNQCIFINIERIIKAISEGKQITYFYNRYSTDHKLHHISAEPFIVNPYHLMLANGHYYLICNEENGEESDKVVRRRIERITEIKEISTPAKSLSKFKEYEDGFKLEEYVRERPFLYNGPAESCWVRIKKEHIGLIIDWFGKHYRYTNEKDNDEYVIVRLKANPDSILYWSMRYIDSVEIVSPKKLRDKALKMIDEARERYGRNSIMTEFIENTENKIEKAIAFAVMAHSGGKRKGTGMPYIVHPAEVCAVAAGITNNEDVIAAAALHDVIEDTEYTKEDIEKYFGKNVLRLVLADSEDKMENRPSSDTWKERKQETIDYLREKAEYDEKIIVLADKLSNIRAICIDYQKYGEDLWNRFNQKDKNMHGWYYKSILENLSELSDTYAYKEYKQLVEKIFKNS